MENLIIAIDQSTSATKAMLFNERCEMLRRVNVTHEQYYPKSGWVEHDAEEIYRNVQKSIAELIKEEVADNMYSLAITNQRETVVVWNKHTGKPICNAVVWQCMRGADICNELKASGYSEIVQAKSGLLLDPYFSASGVKWILDNVEGARQAADNGDLLMGTIDTWLIWKLTDGKRHVTDYTNASRTLLFNIHTMQWDSDLLELFTIPETMMPELLPCDAVFGETTVGGLFKNPIVIAGVLGDSHGALAGQMCFEEGLGKVTYGTGSGNVNRAYTVSLLDGLKNAGYQIDEALKADYEQYIEAENKKNTPDSSQPFSRFMPVPRPTELIPTTKVLSEQVAKADVALVTLGRTSGEFVDRNVSDFELSEEELQLLKSVSQAFHAAGKKVVVVLNIGGVIETASWKKLPDAILLAWQAGQEGGNSVTDVLSGKVSPSGKLTMTFPNKLMDVASSTNFPMDARANTDVRNKEDKSSSVKNVDYTDYEEDIFVGYRYFDSFGKQVSYPFGYGLSYTTFEYVNPSVKVDNGIYSVSIDVKNVGKFAGKEVVQLYVSAPNRFQMNKPEKELKAFTKTKELRPGETVTATLKLNTTDLASYDEASSSWVVDAGNYKFLIGTSSKDIKAVLDVDVVSVVEKTNDILKPQETVNTIKR